MEEQCRSLSYHFFPHYIFIYYQRHFIKKGDKAKKFNHLSLCYVFVCLGVCVFARVCVSVCA